MKRNIIVGVILLLLVGGGAGAFYMLQADSSKSEVDAAGVVAEQGEQPGDPDADPIYLSLAPAFVVNFEHNGSIRYLQLSLQVMSFDQEVVDKVELNMPAVRNTLIMLFSGQDYDSLTTVQGKEDLRKAVLDSINQVVRLTKGHGVNDVFFTGFVMQ